MKRKRKTEETTGTAATVNGFAATSAEFVPSEIGKRDSFTESLNEYYDIIPEIKSEKFK